MKIKTKRKEVEKFLKTEKGKNISWLAKCMLKAIAENTPIGSNSVSMSEEEMEIAVRKVAIDELLELAMSVGEKFKWSENHCVGLIACHLELHQGDLEKVYESLKGFESVVKGHDPELLNSWVQSIKANLEKQNHPVLHQLKQLHHRAFTRYGQTGGAQ